MKFVKIFLFVLLLLVVWQSLVFAQEGSAVDLVNEGLSSVELWTAFALGVIGSQLTKLMARFGFVPDDVQSSARKWVLTIAGATIPIVLVAGLKFLLPIAHIIDNTLATALIAAAWSYITHMVNKYVDLELPELEVEATPS